MTKNWIELGKAFSEKQKIQIRDPIFGIETEGWGYLKWGSNLIDLEEALDNGRLRIEPETITLYEWEPNDEHGPQWFTNTLGKQLNHLVWTKTGRVIRNAVIDTTAEGS